MRYEVRGLEVWDADTETLAGTYRTVKQAEKACREFNLEELNSKP